MRYNRIILKFSGEILKDESSGSHVSDLRLKKLGTEIKFIHDAGIEIGIVIGGGNIARGINAKIANKHSRVYADDIGMLATVINGIYLKDTFETIGIDSGIFCAFDMPKICDLYTVRAAEQALIDGKIAIFTGGTSNPFFSTDSGAALRASELNADVLIKATKVDGIYDKDPKKFPDAKKFDKVSFNNVINQQLRVMDSSAFSICNDNNIKILVIDAENDICNIRRVILEDKNLGTLVE